MNAVSRYSGSRYSGIHREEKGASATTRGSGAGCQGCPGGDGTVGETGGKPVVGVVSWAAWAVAEPHWERSCEAVVEGL